MIRALKTNACGYVRESHQSIFNRQSFHRLFNNFLFAAGYTGYGMTKVDWERIIKTKKGKNDSLQRSESSEDIFALWKYAFKGGVEREIFAPKNSGYVYICRQATTCMYI